MASQSRDVEQAEPLLAPGMVTVPPQDQQEREIAASLRSEPNQGPKRGLSLLALVRFANGCLGLTTFVVTLIEIVSPWDYNKAYRPLATFAFVSLVWQCFMLSLSLRLNLIKVTLSVGKNTIWVCGHQDGDGDGDDDDHNAPGGKTPWWKAKRWNIIVFLVDAVLFFVLVICVAVAMNNWGHVVRVAAVSISLLVLSGLILLLEVVPIFRRLAIVVRDEECEYRIRLGSPRRFRYA